MSLPPSELVAGSLGSSRPVQLRASTDDAGAKQQHAPLALPQPQPQTNGSSSPPPMSSTGTVG